MIIIAPEVESVLFLFGEKCKSKQTVVVSVAVRIRKYSFLFHLRGKQYALTVWLYQSKLVSKWTFYQNMIFN